MDPGNYSNTSTTTGSNSSGVTQKTYQIDRHKQLIPLNGNVPHFTCFFEVKSKDKKPFNITVVEQGEIKPRQYKLVNNGYINGQVESDGYPKTYYLVLKSPEPCECDVKTVLKHGSAQPNISTPLSTTPNSKLMVVKQPESLFQLKYILGVSAILVGLWFLYKYYRKKNTPTVVVPSVSTCSY